MTEPIAFSKLSGSGNDFICIDNRDGRLDDVVGSPAQVSRFARTLCGRSLGVGADGVIFACAPEIEGYADVAARFFEPDGSETELCGNGMGCFVDWAIEDALVPDREVKVLTPAGVVRGQRIDGGYVRVCIPLPEDMRSGLDVCAGGRRWLCDFAVTGVPHLITYVDDIDAVDVARWGPVLRGHEMFQPRGVNANFVQVIAPGRIALRTWEFGVEGETLACGTGAAAAAILSALRFEWPEAFFTSQDPVRVRARSGETLRVYFNRRDDGVIDDVCLETIVRSIYHGRLHADLARRALAAPQAELDAASAE